MDRKIIQAAHDLAVSVIKDAGRIALDRFDRYERLVTKDAYGDVVTEVDHLAEALILERIHAAFPEHQIHSEEAGDNGKRSDWLWLIDPLDGTNNYAIGLPIFTTSITLLYRKEPVLGVVYEPITDRLFVSSLGAGATCNGDSMQVKDNPNFRRGQIGWIQGHQVQNEEKAVWLRQHLDLHFKRMMRLWAPTLQWCLLAKGHLDGIVLYNSEGDDLYSGLLMVQEAGGSIVDFEGKAFRGMTDEPYLIACHPARVNELLSIVHEGLKLRS